MAPGTSFVCCKYLLMNCWVNLQRLRHCSFVFLLSHSSPMVSIGRKDYNPYFSIKDMGHGAVKGINSRIKIWSQDCVSPRSKPVLFTSLNSSFFITLACYPTVPDCHHKKITWLWEPFDSWLVAFSGGSLGNHPSGPSLRVKVRVLCSLDGLTYSQDFIPCVHTDSQIFVSTL